MARISATILAERDGWICNACGEKVVEWELNLNSGTKFATVDHKVFDGGDSLDNLWLLCNSCNGSKGQKPLEEWEQTLGFTGSFMRRGFTTVPNVLLDNRLLSIGAKMTLISLLSFAWKGDPFPGQERLGEMLGVTDRTAREYLSELKAGGYIVVQRRGRGQTNVYRISDELTRVNTRKSAEDSSVQKIQDRKHSSVLDRKPASYKEDEVEEDQSRETIVSLPIDDVRRVHEHWRKARGKTRSNYDTISKGRRQKISLRLKEFSADDLCVAIDNVARDPWAERAMHDDITIIFRSREQVEKFLDMKSASGRSLVNPYSAAEAWVRTTGWQYPDADLWEELGRYDLEPDQKRRLMSLAADMQTKPIKSFEMTGIVRDIP